MQSNKEWRQPWKSAEAAPLDDRAKFDGHSARAYKNQGPSGKLILQGGTGSSIGAFEASFWKLVYYDTEEAEKKVSK
jgi:hypothetical protein